jgi:hypothetical protein
MNRSSIILTMLGKLLAEVNVKYIAAITRNRFPQVFEKLTRKVDKPGQWWGINNPNTSESALYYWSYESCIGKKMVYTNAFEICAAKKDEPVVPIFDHYKASFYSCDRFNRALHDRTWPHKKGGKGVSGGPVNLTAGFNRKSE